MSFFRRIPNHGDRVTGRWIAAIGLLQFGLSVAHAAQGNDGIPDLLTTADGTPVTTVAQWRDVRRAELLELFRSQVYGRAPVERPESLRVARVETTPDMMDGRAIRKQVDLSFTGPGGEGRIAVLIFLPADRSGPVPGFVLICHRDKKNIDPTRRHREDFWPAEEIVDRGFAAIAFHVSDVDPDEDDGFRNGVHGIFTPDPADRAPDAWATIAAWSWGASRVMDYLQSDDAIANDQIAVIGHSRGGKAALWAGARDERFRLVISNESGCTGAAFARRKKGERIKNINTGFPHWFCDRYEAYNGKENAMPVDQHMLLALMAPRAVYVASASRDSAADPRGEFRSCVLAEPAFRLHGLSGLGTDRFPEPGTALHEGSIAYHLRPGRHDMTLFDWQHYLDYASALWEISADGR